jgi:hypothetical protein
MVINRFPARLRMSVENRHNVNTRLGTRSPSVYRGFPLVSTYQHRLLQLLTFLNTKP